MFYSIEEEEFYGNTLETRLTKDLLTKVVSWSELLSFCYVDPSRGLCGGSSEAILADSS